MSISRVLGVLAFAVVAVYAITFWPKKDPSPLAEPGAAEEVIAVIADAEPQEVIAEVEFDETPFLVTQESGLKPLSSDADLPKDVDRMGSLFQPYPPTLPIVETVSYTSKVPWLVGRSAFIGDYASHFQTSKHFISRSLKGVGNYLSDTVSRGDRFNVFKDGKDVEFHLVLDLSRLKLWLYYHDIDENERVLLKCYPVCAGRLDARSPSGSLTPTGVFSLGGEIALYKEGAVGNFQGQPREMVTIFGKRWIPLEREMAQCTGSCRGLGIHGVPWFKHPATGEYIENRACIGNYESSGCIRLLGEDVEEVFAVIVSKPEFYPHRERLPGGTPSR